MGPDETATATTGGPRVIGVFAGNGAPSGPNCTLFRGQIGSQTPSGIGLGSGSPRDRIRRRCGSLVLSESPGSHCQVIHVKTPWAAERNRQKILEAAA